MMKLLAVDDEMLVLVGLKSMLDWKSLGIEYAGTAHNGQQALEQIELIRPDIVLIDINMPVKNGLQVAKECREKYGKLPVFIFLTSYEEFSFAKEAVSVQAIDYLVKISLTPEQLEKSIKKESLSIIISSNRNISWNLQSTFVKCSNNHHSCLIVITYNTIEISAFIN